jgi:hypothetical protein
MDGFFNHHKLDKPQRDNNEKSWQGGWWEFGENSYPEHLMFSSPLFKASTKGRDLDKTGNGPGICGPIDIFKGDGLASWKFGDNPVRLYDTVICPSERYNRSWPDGDSGSVDIYGGDHGQVVVR